MYHKPTINQLLLQKYVIKRRIKMMMMMMMRRRRRRKIIYLHIYTFHHCNQDQRMLLIFATSKHPKKRNYGLAVPLKHIMLVLPWTNLLIIPGSPNRRDFLNMLQFEGVEIEEVDYVPINKNGTHIYRINCPENECTECQKDH